MGALVVGVPSAASSDDDKTTFTVALDGEVDSFSPFLGIVAASYDVGAHLRLHDQLVDGGHVP